MTSTLVSVLRRRLVSITATVLLAAATAGIWAAWLGWETQYDVDAAGNSSGPFQVWQLVGVVICLVSVAFLAVRWTHPFAVVVTVPAVFVVAWSRWAARDADGYLWPVGAFMLSVGMLIAASV